MAWTHKEAMGHLLEWVEEHADDLSGIAAIFGFCDPDSEDSATCFGGVDHGCHAYDEIIMRIAYKIGEKRQHLYGGNTTEFMPGGSDGSVSH